MPTAAVVAGPEPDMAPKKIQAKTVAAPTVLELEKVPAAPPMRKVIAPSDLPGAKALGGEGRGEEEAKLRGRQVHLLLEHIPEAADPVAVAKGLLSYGPDAAEEEEIAGLLEEARRVLDLHPHIFAPGTLAEVDIVADVPALNGKISGTIDRLVISEDRVLAVDFKTNAVVPDSAENTPDGILRQMGAYLEALEQIYPNQRIDIAILWTSNGNLMPLEHGIVRQALRQTPTS